AVAVTAGAVTAAAETAGAVMRRPAFWLWAATCLLGVWIAWRGLDAVVRAFPVGSIAGAALLAPALALGFWALRRLHPVRSRPAGYALAARGLAGCGGACPAHAACRAVTGGPAGREFHSGWGASRAAPVDEEILKLAGVATLALLAPAAIRGPLDGWGYGALTGLGF